MTVINPWCATFIFCMPYQISYFKLIWFKKIHFSILHEFVNFEALSWCHKNYKVLWKVIKEIVELEKSFKLIIINTLKNAKSIKH